MEKDINKYWDKYKSIYSFEEFSAIYREVELLKSVSFKKKSVIEIGCGFKPLFKVVKNFKQYIAIEPGKKPFNSTSRISKNFKNVSVVNSTFQEWSLLNKDLKSDLIIFPGILHEVKDPKSLLKMCLNHIRPGGHIYINVPNVNSLHRKLAVSMGIIKNTNVKSKRNLELEQYHNFSTESLKKLLNSLSKKIKIIRLKTFFLKPFTHSQMLSIFSKGIINHKVIKGLYDISDELDGLGSEIACVIKVG